MQTPEEVKSKIQDICENIIGCRPEPGQNLRFDCGMDSLEQVEMIMEIEKAYNINVPDAIADTVRTLQQAVDSTMALLGEKETEKEL